MRPATYRAGNLFFPFAVLSVYQLTSRTDARKLKFRAAGVTYVHLTNLTFWPYNGLALFSLAACGTGTLTGGSFLFMLFQLWLAPAMVVNPDVRLP